MNDTLRIKLCGVLLSLGTTLAFGAPARAETFARAQGDIDQRLQTSLHELSQVREKIAKEKIPLSRTVSGLQDEVLKLRQKQARLLTSRDDRTIDLTSLRKQVESLRDQEDFVDSRLKEFVREFEGRLNISELPQFEELTAAARLAEKNVNLDVEGKRDAQLAVIDAAIGRLRSQLGGRVFAGEALSPDGILTEGQFVALGPSIFFVSGDGEVAGLVETRLNAADPVVVPLPGNLPDGIAEVAGTGQGALPFDATLGKALKKEKARKSLGQYIADGRVVGYTILAFGASALLLTGFKLVEIMGFRIARPEQVDRVLDELATGSQVGATKLARDVPGVSGEMLLAGVEHADEKRETLEELLFEKILKVRPGLERFLPFLAMTAAAAPLLGLLGTVIGMIRTFQLITIFGSGDAKSLSSGISEALVTTALGLIVAIPTLIVHGALSRMAKHKLGSLEQLSAAFINGLAGIRRRSSSRQPEGASLEVHAHG